MIFTRINLGPTICIIEQGNIDRLRGGKPMVTPDGSFMVIWTPDLKFIENQMQDAMAAGVVLDLPALQRFLEEGAKRKVVTR